MRKIFDSLRDTQPKHYLIIIALALTLTAMSGMSIYRSLAGFSITPTIVEGFPMYSVSIIGEGNVSVSKESIIINDSPDTLTQVNVYSSTSDFVWNFSAIVTEGENESIPLMFSINWGKEANQSVKVWAHAPHLGWYYALFTNSSVDTIRLNVSFTFGSKYDISVNCSQTSDSVSALIKLSNSTWQTSLNVRTSSSLNTPNNLFFLSLQAWARHNATMKVKYFQSQFTSYNTTRYLEQSNVANLALFLSTFFFIILSIITFRKRHLNIFENFLRSLYRIISQKKLHNFGSYLHALFSRNRYALFLVLFFGSIRFVLAAFIYGHGFDLYTFRVWSLLIRENGIATVFPLSDALPPYLGVRPTYPYPPIIMYTLTVLSTILPMESMSYSLFSFVVKTPLIFADLLIGWLTFIMIRKLAGHKIALLALALSLVNMLDSAVWGQFDSFVVLFILLSVGLVISNHNQLGWSFAALALATKQLALPLLPALLILSVKNRRFRSTIFGIMTFSLTLLLVWTPLLFSGFSLDFAVRNSGFGLLSPGGALSLSPEIPGTSIDAFNIWPLITWGKDNITLKQGTAPPPGVPPIDDTLPNQMFGMSYYHFGLLLFLVFYVPILLMIWKASDSSDVMMKLGLLMLAFFIIPTRMHDRYLIFSISFLPLAFATSKIVSIFYAVLTTTFSLNLLYGFSTHVNPFDIPNQLKFMQNIFSDAFILLIILVNIAVFLGFFLYSIKQNLTKKHMLNQRDHLEEH